MATLTVQTADTNGLLPTFNQVASGGDNFVNAIGDILLLFRSASAAKTVTISTPATAHGEAIAETSVTVPASGFQFAGTFNPDIYNASGKVSMTYSDKVGLTVAVVRAARY